MPYTVNGKVHSSHALMDEIIFNTKKIINGLILKNEKVANNSETENSILQSDYYIAIKNGSMELEFFPLTKEMLIEYGCEETQASIWAADYNEIPEEERDSVLEFCSNYFVENYVEENNYYRKLAGLPEYNNDHPDDYVITLSKYDYTDEDGILRNEFDDRLSLDDFNSDFTPDRPIHTYNITQLNTLESLGILDIIREKEIYNKPKNATRTIIESSNVYRTIDDSAIHYEYLNFLGSKAIDIYNARIAKNWEIIYCPTVEYLVESRFKELYTINRYDYDRRVNQLAYDVESDYYQEMVMFMIVCQTFADMITDTPEWYIRRDVFDLRTVKYFLDSQGVQFFEDIPIRYQVRIVKGLNKLIRYKSTNKNIDDILEIFSVRDVSIYKYYLFKKYKYTDLREFIDGLPDPGFKMEDEYDFGLVTDDSIDYDGLIELFDFYDMDTDDYKEDEDGTIRYYDFESEDPEWSGAYDDFDDYSEHDLVYDFYNEEEFPDVIHNTAKNGIDILDGNELYDYGLLDPTVVEDYNDLTVIHDYGDEDAEYVNSSETTDKNQNYREKNKIIKDEYGNVYGLEFVKTPINETYDDYIKDSIYREDYDSVVNQDKFWDGEDVHYYVRNNHLKKDFTIEGTKYMGLEYNVSIKEFNYVKEYYLGLLFNGNIDTDDIHIAVPSIADKEFSLINLMIFIYCCNDIYLDRTVKIKDLSKSIEVKTLPKPDFEPYADVDGGRPWTNGSEYTPEEPTEDIVEEDWDFGEITDTSIDNDGSASQIHDFGYNIDIDYNDPNLEIYDFGNMADSGEAVIIVPEEPEIEYEYDYDALVFVKPTRPYMYNNMYHINQETGEMHLITKQYIDDNWDEIVGHEICIKYYWNTLKPEEFGIYEVDLDCRHPGDFNDVDYYLDIDGGYMIYSSRVTRSYFYDYINTDHPYTAMNTQGRIYGFNMDIDLEQLAENIGFRHLHFGFERGYTLADCGCDTFMTAKDFNNLDQLYNIFNNNTKCYNNIIELINSADNRDERRVYEYVFNQLFTIPWDSSFYILRNGDMATTYDQILKEKDYTLYNTYLSLKNEADSEIRKYNVRNILNDLVDTLSYYIQGDNLRYALTFVSTNSFDAMIHYISEMIDFFKSWKVYFLNPRISYKVDDKENHKVGLGDHIEEYKIKYWTPYNAKTADNLGITVKLYESIPNYDPKLNKSAEVSDIAVHYMDHDPLGDKMFDGFGPEELDIEIYDLDGGGVHELTHQQEWYAETHNIHVINEKCVPYYNLDGGEIANGKDLYCLDGGGPKDVEYYLNVDGLSISDERNFKPIKPCMSTDIEYFYIIDADNPSEKFNTYVIEGGRVDTEEVDIDINGMTLNAIEVFKPIRPIDVGNPTGTLYIDSKEIVKGSKRLVSEVKPTIERFFVVEGGRPDIHHIEDPSTIIDIDEYNQVGVHARISKSKYNGLKLVQNDETAEAPIWPLRNTDFGDISNQTLINGKLYNAEIIDFGDEDSNQEEYDPSYGDFWDMDYGEITEISDDFVEPDELLAGSGLYFDHGTFAKAEEIESSLNIYTQFKNQTVDTLYRYRDTVIQYSDIVKVEQDIRDTLKSNFTTYNKVRPILNKNTIVSDNQNIADATIQSFYDWFSEQNPYKWVALEEEESVNDG